MENKNCLHLKIDSISNRCDNCNELDTKIKPKTMMLMTGNSSFSSYPSNPIMSFGWKGFQNNQLNNTTKRLDPKDKRINNCRAVLLENNL